MGVRRSVVVTGLGPITPVGTGVERLWESVVAGRSGTRALDFGWLDDPRPFKTRIGAPVEEEPEPSQHHISDQEVKLLDPASRLAVAAASMALQDAGFEIELVDERRGQCGIKDLDSDRAGVVLGTGIGGLCTVERSHRLWVLGEPLTGSTRFALPMLIPNAIPAQIAIKFDLRGECKAVTTACAAGTMAIGDAARLVRDGDLDVIVTGGVDRTLSDVDGYSLYGFDLLRTMSTRNESPASASRPFDADRDGFVLGEGAGVLVIEDEEHARARGARVYARVLGYGSTCDAHSMMQLRLDGSQLVRVMRRALADAGLAPDDVAYVNAHGTSTRQNDPTEARAIRTVLGRAVSDVLVNSTKAMTGHCIGAAGGIEAIVTVLSLFRGVVHRCVNLDRQDPECDVALPRDNATIPRRAALSNSFGFGGHNATLVLGPA